jgi:hypothetical protein
MSTALAIPLHTYDDAPDRTRSARLAEGTYIPRFGVPRWPADSLSVGGRYALVPLTDPVAEALTPGTPLLTMTSAGLRGVRVARVRTVLAGELGHLVPVPVVDARDLDGRCLTYAPGDLYDVRVLA